MQGRKKVPMRQCLGCREMKPKKELSRIVRTPDGEVLLDVSGRVNGRGAYVCHDSTCLKKAVKSRALSRALDIQIPEEIINLLENQLESADG